MRKTCIIVGASHAGAQLAASLRQEGWEGRIVMIGEEPHLPYHRPPLSKAYLSGDKSFEDILIRNRDSYARFSIEVMLNQRVASLDPSAKQLRLASGEVLDYDKLALCTGARVRMLPAADFDNVLYLRGLDDLERMRGHIREGAKAVIIGGGYIGLETAASLRKYGVDVTVLELAPRILARVTAPELSAFYTRIHTEEGVRVLTQVKIERFVADHADPRRLVAVEIDGGPRIEIDFAVAGIGVVPNVELAEQAGLRIEGGIVTDEYAQTSDPDIVAAGDCTVHPVRGHGLRRIESVGNAVEQAKTAAASICGKSKPDQSLPWFWSDQYDLKLQMAGLNTGYDQLVIRGTPHEGRSFSAFYLCEGRVIAADCVNRPSDFLVAKKLISEGCSPDPQDLADLDRTLKDFLV